MNRYYRGQNARRYNRRWQAYTAKTLAEASAMVDSAALQRIIELGQRVPRMLDLACGTGILLQQMMEQVPGMEVYGIDASADMLEQARKLLGGQPHVHLARADLNAGEGLAHVFSSPQTFDLITCTNVLHDLAHPRKFLTALRALLTPEGQLVIEDFAPRRPAVLWGAFERLLGWIEKVPVHALTLDEVQILCEAAGLRVVAQKTFVIDWFWHGWVLRYTPGNQKQ